MSQSPKKAREALTAAEDLLTVGLAAAYTVLGFIVLTAVSFVT